MTLFKLHRMLIAISIIFNIVTTVISRRLVNNIKDRIKELKDIKSRLSGFM